MERKMAKQGWRKGASRWAQMGRRTGKLPAERASLAVPERRCVCVCVYVCACASVFRVIIKFVWTTAYPRSYSDSLKQKCVCSNHIYHAQVVLIRNIIAWGGKGGEHWKKVWSWSLTSHGKILCVTNEWKTTFLLPICILTLAPGETSVFLYWVSNYIFFQKREGSGCLDSPTIKSVV